MYTQMSEHLVTKYKKFSLGVKTRGNYSVITKLH